PLPAPAVVTSASLPDSFNTSSSGSSTTSTFNIIQMINAIKNQKPVAISGGASPSGNYRYTRCLLRPGFKLLVRHKIVIKDKTFGLLEKLELKQPQTKDNNSDGEKSQKQTDPRLKKGPSDPRLNKPADCPNSGKVADPRLQRALAQSRPADPRLARQMVGNLDPRLSRQNSVDGVFSSGPINNMGGSPVNSMGAGPINSMGAGPINSMLGGPINCMLGGSINSMGAGPINSMGAGPINSMGAGPINSMGAGPLNSMGAGPINSMGSGPINSMGAGPLNSMGAGPLNSMGAGPLNSMGAGCINNMGGGPNNSMGGGSMNTMGGVMNGQMGGSGNGMGVFMSSPGGSVNPIGGSMSKRLHSIGPGVNTESHLSVANPMNNPNIGPGRPFLGSGGPLNNTMGVVGGPVRVMAGSLNQNGGPYNPVSPGASQMIRMGGPHGLGSRLGGSGSPMDSHIRGPSSQQNPLANDPGMLDPRINNPSGARPGNQRTEIDPPGINDPRLKNRLMDPREQRMSSKDPRSAFRDAHQGTASSPSGDGIGDSGMIQSDSDFRSLQNSSRVLEDFQQSPHYLQNDLPSFQWTHTSDHKTEHNESLQSPSSSSMLSSTQHSDAEKPTRKFDYRNDPRFKRVKRLPGQPKNSMEYNSPLSGEDGQGDTDGRADPGYNGYFKSRLPSSGDPRSRTVSSPTLPDTLQDFDLPTSSAEIAAESELDLKVKDHFKTIDPTASPFC
ncbi:unnamed protein product, partial [Candidula unifasciata]